MSPNGNFYGKNAETYDRQIDEEIIKYIATNIKSNIRELEGAFNKIIAFAKLNKVDLTLSLAEEAEGCHLPQQAKGDHSYSHY